MIGLIFGETDFPKYILKKLKKNKKYIIIDITKKKIFKKDKNSYSVSIGQFGKIISILKSNNCKKVLFAGKVAKPNLKKIKLDLKGLYYIPKIIKSSKIGDAAILKQVINILRIECFEYPLYSQFLLTNFIFSIKLTANLIYLIVMSEKIINLYGVI